MEKIEKIPLPDTLDSGYMNSYEWQMMVAINNIIDGLNFLIEAISERKEEAYDKRE